MNNVSEKINLRQWAQDMADQKASKLSRRKWCESKGIPLSTCKCYYGNALKGVRTFSWTN